MKKTPLERFMRWIEKRADGCWIWTGRRAFGGSYGQFGVSEKVTKYAHRFSYEAHIGPVPSGKQLDHLCRNRLCCNPAHLEPVTRRENILRGIGPTAKNAIKKQCPYGHDYSPENTYIRPSGKRVCKQCRRAADNKEGPRERRKLHKRKLRLAQRNAEDKAA